MFEKWKIKVKQYDWHNGFQKWVKRIYLYDDKELERLNDWSIGFYHCEQCGVYKGFSYKLPVKGQISKECQNDWVDFFVEHAHGDGRVILFEKKL